MIKFKQLLQIQLLSFIVILSSCGKHEVPKEAIELQNRAMELQMGADAEKLDSAILLLNQAIWIDPEFYIAYWNIMPLLFQKGDYDRMLDANEKLIALTPNRPYWVNYRGLIYEWKGDTINAKKYYLESLDMYRDILENEDDYDWNFELEYVTSLNAAGEIKQAEQELVKLRKKYPKNELLKEVKIYSKEEILKSNKK